MSRSISFSRVGGIVLCSCVISGCSLGIEMAANLVLQEVGPRAVNSARYAMFPLPEFTAIPLPSDEQMIPTEMVTASMKSPLFKNVEYVPELYAGELENRYAKLLDSALTSSNLKGDQQARYILKLSNLTTLVPDSAEKIRIGFDSTYISADVEIIDRRTGDVLFSEWVRSETFKKMTGDSSPYGWIPTAVGMMVREHISKITAFLRDDVTYAIEEKGGKKAS